MRVWSCSARRVSDVNAAFGFIRPQAISRSRFRRMRRRFDDRCGQSVLSFGLWSHVFRNWSFSHVDWPFVFVQRAADKKNSTATADKIANPTPANCIADDRHDQHHVGDQSSEWSAKEIEFASSAVASPLRRITTTDGLANAGSGNAQSVQSQRRCKSPVAPRGVLRNANDTGDQSTPESDLRHGGHQQR